MDNSSGKKRKICLRCYDIVDSHRRRLLRKLEDGESLLSEQLPVPRDLVLLEDSDENSETDSSEESEFEMDTGELLSSSAGSSSGSAMSGDFEQQLDKIMGSAIQKMNFDKQLTTATKDLKDRLDSFKDDFEATDKMYENLEGEVDNLRKELYKDFEPRIEELPPVDLNKISLTRPLLPSGASGQLTPGIHSPSSILTSHALPPAGGFLSRPALALGQQVIAMRHGNLQTWKPGVVEELQDPGEVDERLYRVRFEGIQGNKNVVQKKLLKVKNVAYSSVSRVRLPVGTRCIGVFRESEDQVGTFYSGVIAEPPKQTNRNRYLVFFDDGYASYIRHEELRLVCYQSENVWDDVHIDSREFIKKYLDKYPERPMVKLSPGQIVKTEWDGRWCQTRVITVDASLVRVSWTDSFYSPLCMKNSSIFSSNSWTIRGWSGFTGAPLGLARCSRRWSSRSSGGCKMTRLRRRGRVTCPEGRPPPPGGGMPPTSSTGGTLRRPRSQGRGRARRMVETRRTRSR